jgi:pimeloyl-ACP methyl ester carboxylesterase
MRGQVLTCLLWTLGSALLTPVRQALVGLSPLIPAEPAGKIEEVRAKELLKAVSSIQVEVPTFISPSGIVETSFALFKSGSGKNVPKGIMETSFESGSAKKKAPIVMLHGFDSSCLEYRRLAPLLAEGGDRDVIIPDLLGWGFTRPPADILTYGPEAKMEHLRAFIRQVCGNGPVVVVGASLGGALAVLLAAQTPQMVEKVVLIDAQGFIDGKGPSNLPVPLARLGVNVLKSSPLRMFANILAYSDKKFATLDAMRVGKLHCYTQCWEDASINFLLSGGFSPSSWVDKVTQQTLLLWGRNDEILEPKTAEKFVETMPRCTLKWVEDCGHVPHLEKPELTSETVLEFLKN